MSEGLRCAVAAGLMLCASGRVSTGDVLNQEEEVPAMTKTQKGIRFRYGFRHDPMKWINESESVPAAQVRTFCLKRPKPGDKARAPHNL